MGQKYSDVKSYCTVLLLKIRKFTLNNLTFGDQHPFGIWAGLERNDRTPNAWCYRGRLDGLGCLNLPFNHFCIQVLRKKTIDINCIISWTWVKSKFQKAPPPHFVLRNFFRNVSRGLRCDANLDLGQLPGPIKVKICCLLERKVAIWSKGCKSERHLLLKVKKTK